MGFDFSPLPEVDDANPSLYFSPNPHFGDFATPGKPTKKVDKPYSQAISAGKNTYAYDAHTYHTKVPPQGIETLINYYTFPGDTILDPFCGSGMTGLAATSIGRKALLSDLSPAAVFIAYNLNTPIEASRYLHAVDSLLFEATKLEQSLYGTHCRICTRIVPALYMVWSYGMFCKYCQREFILWDVARDEHLRIRDSKIKAEFDCPHCGRLLKKRELKRTSRYPVSVGYRCCQGGPKEITESPDEYDTGNLARIENEGIPPDLWYPTVPFPKGVNTTQPISAGIDTVDKAYTTRALWAMAYLWERASKWPDEDIRNKLLFTLTSLYQRVTVFSEFRFWGGSGNTANYNVPAIMNEQNVFRAFARKANTISWYFRSIPISNRKVEVSTQSACHLTQIPDRSIDYVFTDPPFGANINYSEMNFLWESWLGAYTDNEEEIIMNKVQKKSVDEYGKLLAHAFSEIRRVLKDESWFTIIFHNSSDHVWNALQTAIRDAGFDIRGTQTFDKRHGTFKQFVSDNAVGYDLVLHCRKSETIRLLLRNSQTETLTHAIDFINEALNRYPQEYIVHYLHVAREDEFDYRRLYANWLAEALPKSLVSLSFEEFRSLVGRVFKQRSNK